MIFRSSHSQMYFKIDVLKNFALLKPLPNKVAGLLLQRVPMVAASEFSRQQIPFLQLIGIYC